MLDKILLIILAKLEFWPKLIFHLHEAITNLIENVTAASGSCFDFAITKNLYCLFEISFSVENLDSLHDWNLLAVAFNLTQKSL